MLRLAVSVSPHISQLDTNNRSVLPLGTSLRWKIGHRVVMGITHVDLTLRYAKSLPSWNIDASDIQSLPAKLPYCTHAILRSDDILIVVLIQIILSLDWNLEYVWCRHHCRCHGSQLCKTAVPSGCIKMRDYRLSWIFHPYQSSGLLRPWFQFKGWCLFLWPTLQLKCHCPMVQFSCSHCLGGNAFKGKTAGTDSTLLIISWTCIQVLRRVQFRKLNTHFCWHLWMETVHTHPRQHILSIHIHPTCWRFSQPVSLATYFCSCFSTDR